MAERCVRCNVSGDEVRLFDAIYEGRIGRLCERCSIIENIPIIKKPAASQLKDSEKGFGVYDRMKRLSGIKDFKKQETFFREDRLRELNENPNLETPEKDKLNLIDYFHWEIMKNRRRKGLSQKQLAERIGESETAIQMIEKAKLPDKAEQLIKKIEQFLQIRLTKISDTQRFFQEKRRVPVLLDREGRELSRIPEPEIKIETREKDSESGLIDNFLDSVEARMEEFKNDETEDFNDEEIYVKEPKQILTGIDIERGEFDIEKADLNEVRISDLKELHRKKIEATRKEQIEEQKRIEARNRLIEARKEEIRMIKERESQDLDKLLGGTELLEKKDKIEFEDEDSDKEIDFDEEDEN